MRLVLFSVFAVLLAATVSAHNYATAPLGRDGTTNGFSGSGPCDGPVPVIRKTLNAGDSFTLTYSTNHPGTYVTAFIATANLPATGNTAQAAALYFDTVTYPTSNDVPNGGRTITIPVPGDAATGNYTAQFWWNNWYSCVDVAVVGKSASPPDQFQTGSGSSGSSSAAGAAVVGAVAIVGALVVLGVLYVKGNWHMATGNGAGASAATAASPLRAYNPPAVVVQRSVSPRTLPAGSPPNFPAASPSSAGLPPNWDTAVDDKGNIYYYHTQTNQVQWERPVA